MRRTALTLVPLLLAGCGDNGPGGKFEDVNVLLARVCERAALCPDVSATQAEIDACPGELLSELSASQRSALERFLAYTESQQSCILECMGGEICGRFGGSLSNISDSDLIEPYETCEQQCLVGSAARTTALVSRGNACLRREEAR